MINFSIKKWAAWAPGIESIKQWKMWSEEPYTPSFEGTPECGFIPGRKKRRISRFSRFALQSAYNCIESEDNASNIITVFSTRHGEMEITVNILNDLTADGLISPHHFSHSVHNTPSGHFCINTSNRNSSTTVSSQFSTFCSGFLEACCSLHENKNCDVLYTFTDIMLPEPLTGFEARNTFPLSLSILLSAGSSQNRYSFSLEAGNKPLEEDRVFCPAQMIKWLCGSSKKLSIDSGGTRWIWEKESATEKEKTIN